MPKPSRNPRTDHRGRPRQMLGRLSHHAGLIVFLAGLFGMASLGCTQTPDNVHEFSLDWPGRITASPAPGAASDTGSVANHCSQSNGSTHELTFNHRQGGKVFWITGQNYGHIARVELDGARTFFDMGTDSG